MVPASSGRAPKQFCSQQIKMHINKDFQREYSVHRDPVCDFSLDMLPVSLREDVQVQFPACSHLTLLELQHIED